MYSIHIHTDTSILYIILLTLSIVYSLYIPCFVSTTDNGIDCDINFGPTFIFPEFNCAANAILANTSIIAVILLAPLYVGTLFRELAERNDETVKYNRSK